MRSKSAHGAMQLLVFSRKGEETAHVTETWEVTCGIGNVIQNKGALGVVVVPRGAGAPPIAFMTAHLAAHASKVSARNKDYQRIETMSHERFVDSEHAFFFGDLNYRLDLSKEDCELSLGSLNSLLEHDQLRAAMSRGDAFTGFAEGPINFPPTFKFDFSSDSYDTSKKRRVPSWTDRVLYRPGPELLSYNALGSVRSSDHRPVVAKFSIVSNDKMTEATS